MKIVVAPSARNDLLGIWSYIAKDNVAAADKLQDRFESFFRQLAPNPHLGERCPQFGAELRQFSVDGYVIFYDVDQVAERVNIKAVIHGARDLPSEVANRGLGR